MNWLRYSGRIILGLGVIALALWATENKLIEISVGRFWGAILVYLFCAELAWTLVERRSRETAARLPRAGLLRVSRWDRINVTVSKWLFDGGRTRYADVLVRHDALRDVLQPLQAAVFTHGSGLRIHLLEGPPCSGRSTLLLRLARMLAEQGAPVFLAMPGGDITCLDKVVSAAKTQQTYLLIDDLDLRPQVEDWLHELHCAGVPIVVVGTVDVPHLAQDDAVHELRPVGLMSRAVRHNPQITANDLAVLSRKLDSLGRLSRPGLTLDTTANLCAAVRYLQGKDPDTGLWADVDSPAFAQSQKLMLALCGMAELAIPDWLYVPFFGPKAVLRWHRAGLVWLDEWYALPPHRAVCRDLIATTGPQSEALAAALTDLVRMTVDLRPAFACRLLYGLARAGLTRELAHGVAQALPQVADPASWPAREQRAWSQVLEELDLPLRGARPDQDYPPQLLLQTRAAFDDTDYETALALSQRLAQDPSYEVPAGFNVALSLLHLGRLDEAESVLEDLKPPPPGAHYLRGLIAQQKGDWLKALQAYEASRRADELLLPATRRLAFAYLKTGGPRAAIPLFEALLSHTPLHPELYGGLAVAHLQAGMAQRAAAQSARAIQAGVDPAAARKAVARACAEVYAYGRVASELEACLSYDDDDMEAWAGLADASRWLGRFEREAECLQRLQQAHPEDEELCLQMARNQRDQGCAEVALDLLEPLLTADEPPLRALLLAAEVLAGRGDPDLQEALARRALSQGEASGWASYWLADSLSRDGNLAAEAYQQAVRGLKRQLAEGLPPRRAAKVWQAIYVAATWLQDQPAAGEAARKARQEAAICEALGGKVESVVHHRAVAPQVFLESLPAAAEGPSSRRVAQTYEAAPAPHPPVKESFG